MSCQLTHQAPNRTLKPLKGDKKKIRNQNKSKGNKIQIWFCVVHFVLATSRKLLNDALLLVCSLYLAPSFSLCASLSRSFSKSLKMSELWQAFELHSQPIVTEASWTLPKIKRGSRKARPARRYVCIYKHIYLYYIYPLTVYNFNTKHYDFGNCNSVASHWEHVSFVVARCNAFCVININISAERNKTRLEFVRSSSPD